MLRSPDAPCFILSRVLAHWRPTVSIPDQQHADTLQSAKGTGHPGRDAERRLDLQRPGPYTVFVIIGHGEGARSHDHAGHCTASSGVSTDATRGMSRLNRQGARIPLKPFGDCCKQRLARG
jgi:hypothetical protein